MPDATVDAGATTVGLADAIRALRAELTAAMAEGQGQELKFKSGPVEMEFALEVTKEAGVEAGVKFWVVTLGGKGSVSAAATHRVKLELQPVGEGGTDFVINDTVSGSVTGVR
jgi:hypothetical protein